MTKAKKMEKKKQMNYNPIFNIIELQKKFDKNVNKLYEAIRASLPKDFKKWTAANSDVQNALTELSVYNEWLKKIVKLIKGADYEQK